MSRFNREHRYVVIKRSDLENLRGGQTEGLRQQLNRVSPLLPKREFLVIESDWPEYEPVWRLIEQRMSGAAPVVERQPSLWVHPSYLVRREGMRPMAIDATLDQIAPLQVPLYAAPPELAELQATIDRLTAERDIWRKGSEDNNVRANSLQREIERLKGGQGEPVAVVPSFYWVSGDEGSWNSPEEWAQDYYENSGEHPESITLSCALELPSQSYDQIEFDADGNCVSMRLLDKVKELNQ